ncbi:MAG: aryl-sulfate sulfotransferase [Bacteroidota bacterium]|nr:aryl-sulfate sulfotransferase [Bacteroidota bacterium]
MKIIILAFALLSISINLNAKIIYIEPVQNAQYVNIYNNVIIGFDEIILSSDLNSLITVTGSLSGVHTGEIISTDKKKLIFKPHLPFVFNEKVDVKLNHIKTSVTINNSLSYSFQTQTKNLKRDSKNTILEESGYSSEKSFVNSPDVNNFPQITVTVSNNPSPGYIFMSNFPFTRIPNTPYLIIANNDGTRYFSRQLTSNGYAFQKQINGYLTYYSGGDQKFYALDSQYNLIDSFYTGNGYITDGHELQILSNGHALLMSYDPQIVDMSQLVPGGNSKAIVDGLIIQEIDVNKNVVFQWRSWDHIRITDAIHEDLTAAYVDYVHGNAIERDNDGNILICSRHLSEITKINRTTGDIIWRLGGVSNQFTFVNDSIGFSYQHDIRRLPNGNITLYDNGNFRGRFSRAVEYQLDEINKTATLVWQYRNTPDLYGFAMGSAQRLPGGNTLICWGSANPNITEVTPQGTKALEMTLPQGIYTYRAFKTDMPAAFHDAGVTVNVEPTDTLLWCAADTIAPKATIKNFGNVNEYIPFEITYSITGPVNYVSTKADTLSAGLSRTITFDNTFLPNISGSYIVKIYTSLATDSNRTNDTLITSFVVKTYDVAVTANVQPKDTLFSTNLDTIAPKAIIQNLGADQTTAFNITYYISGPVNYISTKSDTLASGQSRIITFDRTFVPNITGTYNVKIFTSLGSDCNRLNDTLSTTFTVLNPNGVALNVTIGIEGFWNGSTQVRDTMRLYLRNSTSPYGLIDSSIIYLDSLGNGIAIFPNAATGNYYVQTKHRNALEVWSANPLAFMFGDTTNYDFTSSQSQTFGNNAKFKLLRYCSYSGDVNQDGFVNLNDIILISNNSSNFINGYVNTDLNGDNITNLSDILLSYNNSKGFVSVVRP